MASASSHDEGVKSPRLVLLEAWQQDSTDRHIWIEGQCCSCGNLDLLIDGYCDVCRDLGFPNPRLPFARIAQAPILLQKPELLIPSYDAIYGEEKGEKLAYGSLYLTL